MDDKKLREVIGILKDSSLNLNDIAKDLRAFISEKKVGESTVKASLTFDMTDYDARQEFESMQKHGTYHDCLHEIYNMLRKYYKYDHRDAYEDEKDASEKELSSAEYKLVQQIADKFFEILSERGVEI